MSQEFYYIAPPQEAFDEMKKACLALWDKYDDTHGYATEKKNMIKDIGNIRDNFMYMVAMFDQGNQVAVLATVSPETAEEFFKRMA